MNKSKMSFTKKKVFYIGLSLIVIGAGCLLLVHLHTEKMSDMRRYASVAIANSIIATGNMTFEIATTTAAQEQGLSDRKIIPDNYAMLFVFPTDGMYGFWMKDMLESLDMIWVTDNGTIAAIDASVSPATYPGVFYPPFPIRYVLETRAGFAAEKGWHVGTQIALPSSILLPTAK